jgi:hypothetical protein
VPTAGRVSTYTPPLLPSAKRHTLKELRNVGSGMAIPVVRNFETVPGIFRRCRGFSALCLLTSRFPVFRGSRQNSAPEAHVWRFGVCPFGLRLSEKPSAQAQLAIDG